MASLFEFLFKYRGIAFEQGDFAFGAPGSFRVWLGIAAVIAASAVATYTIARGKSSVVDRGVMAGLRVALLGLLVFCLMQPTLRISTVVPQQNFVGVLIDDSRSMGLDNEDGTRRSDFVAEAFTPGTGNLFDGLSERFVLRFFRFSDFADRIDGLGELTYDGTHTNVARALDAAREDLAGVPLAGLVMVTDGADNDDRPLTEALVPLQAAGVPVFTVGLGDETIEPDIELGRVELPRAVLEGSTLMVDVVVTQHGFGQRTVPIIVSDDTRILAEESVELGPDGEPVVARIGFELEQAGSRRIEFQIPTQSGERVEENNHRTAWVDVRGEREKILYYEGEPRFEVKFMRRAVEDDENLQLVVLQRTAESKFLRLSVSDSTELAFGFPSTREELYRYRALVLGSVEASFFTFDQLQMIADFVSVRGGGLLFIGGHSAFAEGGWMGTPVEEVLPVILREPGGTGPQGYFAEVKVEPTPAGLAHPAVQLDAELSAVAARCDSLPALTVVNPITRTRPGATTLLEGINTDGITADRQVVLAFQRYGRGTSIALTPQDTWLWQMHADVPLEDQSHESFWQQMLRWLVDGVPDAVSVVTDQERVEPGETVRLVATVSDSTYLEVNDAGVTATVTSPSGIVDELPVEWTVEEDGEYIVEFRPSEMGDYEITLEASREGSRLGTDVSVLHVARSDDEYFASARRTSLLQRVADETGGRFYNADDVSTLPEDISISGAGVTLTEEHDLWDMPAIFLMMMLLMGAEWGFRRIRGLV
jgi:uncharacterized membrane protein